MRKAGHALKRHVLANEDIETQTRVGVLHTHISPKREYAIGGSYELSTRDMGIYHRTVVDFI